MNYRYAISASLLCCGFVTAADAPRTALATHAPYKLSAADAAGPVFSSKTAVKLTDPEDGPVTDVVLLKSHDGRYEAGLYQAGPSEQTVESYPTEEFIYLIEGGIKLTSADGTVVDAKAGESLSIPKGWKGHWSTAGYKKYYVIYTGAVKAK
jgi:uncharacterized cupin superfamily protein